MGAGLATVDSFAVNAVTGEGTYVGTYHCT
jgi:hypothetical protein